MSGSYSGFLLGRLTPSKKFEKVAAFCGALKELGKSLNAYFMRWDALNFGFETRETYHPSEKAYLEEHAEIVMNQILSNPVLLAKTSARKRYSPQWVWENQL